MYIHDRSHPRLRYLEAEPDPEQRRIIVRDPTHLAAGALVLGEVQFTLLTLLDGRPRAQVQSEFARRFGQPLTSADLDGLLDQLDNAGFLAGAGFERYYEGLVREYQEAPFRPLRDANSYGAPAAELRGYLNQIVGASETDARSGRVPAPAGGRLAGIIAPHLDFGRGLPCYGDAYHHLRQSDLPRRVVVLGTNHFGRASSVVGTDKDFETPWGVLPTDREFVARLQAECGGNLMPYPLDHLREHSVELHAVWLHHLLGDQVRIVPFLCPDPSGPRGTLPGDEGAVDVRDFALALGKLVREDPEPTLIVASADLSHVGRYFNDDQALTDTYLQHIRTTDETALCFVAANDPEGFRSHMAQTRNPTNICSVGCIYTALVALSEDATPQKLRYHQAVTPELENAVTCTSFAFYS